MAIQLSGFKEVLPPHLLEDNTVLNNSKYAMRVSILANALQAGFWGIEPGGMPFVSLNYYWVKPASGRVFARFGA